MTRMADMVQGWLAVVAACLAVVALLVVEARHMALPLAAPVITAPQPAEGDAPRISLQPILDFLPFGAVDPQGVTAPAATQPVAAAEGGLILQGILLRDGPVLSRAMVSDAGLPAQGYAIGDALPGGGTLTGIEGDRITIELDGETITLGFPDQGLAAVEQDVTGQMPADLVINSQETTPAASAQPLAAPQPGQPMIMPTLP